MTTDYSLVLKRLQEALQKKIEIPEELLQEQKTVEAEKPTEQEQKTEASGQPRTA